MMHNCSKLQMHHTTITKMQMKQSKVYWLDPTQRWSRLIKILLVVLYLNVERFTLHTRTVCIIDAGIRCSLATVVQCVHSNDIVSDAVTFQWMVWTSNGTKTWLRKHATWNWIENRVLKIWRKKKPNRKSIHLTENDKLLTIFKWNLQMKIFWDETSLRMNQIKRIDILGWIQ